MSVDLSCEGEGSVLVSEGWPERTPRPVASPERVRHVRLGWTLLGSRSTFIVFQVM